MKVKAKKAFESITDLTVNRKRVYGEVFEVTEERAKVLLGRDLVEVVEEEKKPKKKTTKKK